MFKDKDFIYGDLAVVLAVAGLVLTIVATALAFVA